MKLTVLAVSLALACAFTSAEARPKHRSHHHVASHDPRPRAWCGYWMRHRHGVADRAYNLARKWAAWGSAASGPCKGCIGVQPHHVFEVVEVIGPGKVLAISGNDGNRVRTRIRSTRHVIAWRRPHASFAAAE